MKLRTHKLLKSHFRKDFECGKELLDNYLKKQATQDVTKKLLACFVFTEKLNEIDKVIGYYTLSNSSISSELIPEKYKRKFPKSYKTIPVTLLGRLAVDKSYFGHGLGKFLLMEALYRSYLSALQVASFGVVVDPIDNEAISFYEKYSCILLPDSGKMLLPMGTIDMIFKDF